MTIEIDRSSEEKLLCSVTSDLNPTSQAVSWAFSSSGAQPTTWHDGSWVTDSAEQLRSSLWKAVAETPVIGLGAVDLAVGDYDVRIKVGLAVEKVGQIRIT